MAACAFGVLVDGSCACLKLASFAQRKLRSPSALQCEFSRHRPTTTFMCFLTDQDELRQKRGTTLTHTRQMSSLEGAIKDQHLLHTPNSALYNTQKELRHKNPTVCYGTGRKLSRQNDVLSFLKSSLTLKNLFKTNKTSLLLWSCFLSDWSCHSSDSHGIVKETRSDRENKIYPSVIHRSIWHKNSSKNFCLNKLTLQAFSLGFQTEARKT